MFSGIWAADCGRSEGMEWFLLNGLSANNDPGQDPALAYVPYTVP